MEDFDYIYVSGSWIITQTMESSTFKFNIAFSLLSLIYLFVVLKFPLTVALNSTEEAVALLKWKTSLQNHNHSSLYSWTLSSVNATNISSDKSPCSWYWIHCNHAGSVNSINLTGTSLKGRLQNFSFSLFPPCTSCS